MSCPLRAPSMSPGADSWSVLAKRVNMPQISVSARRPQSTSAGFPFRTDTLIVRPHREFVRPSACRLSSRIVASSQDGTCRRRVNAARLRGRESDTAPVRLLDGETASIVLNHQRHRAAQESLAKLIAQLRECASVEDGYALQHALLAQVLAVEADRNAFSRAVKRIAAGKGPQAGAPDPQSGLDPALAGTWEIERDLCERIGRQYRCVGDALAWRVFGFERRHIIALCQNAPPGVMEGKEGLSRELAQVAKARADGQFAILHDLTNCLRIGDLTVFENDGTFETIEVKTDPARRSPEQKRRIRAARAAVRDGSPLSRSDPKSRLYDLDLPYKNELKVLRDGVVRAASDGFFVAKLPGDRVLLVSDLVGYTLRGEAEDEWFERLQRKHSVAVRRAGIGSDRAWNIHATSMDSVSRDPTRVPFAVYPLPPWACARIIGDLAIFHVETSGRALEQSLIRAEIETQWIRAPGLGGELAPGEVVMEMTTRSYSPVPAGLAMALHRSDLTMEHTRTLQMRRSELDKYLIEMLDQNTWIQGIRYMLADPGLDGRPWPHYRGEDQVWL